MTGPKILARPEEAAEDTPQTIPANATGIRRTNTGGWAAIVGGRLKAEFRGMGSKARAIRSAGTNAVVT